MLVRLWWKEYRVFGPVWLALVLAAAGLQGLFLLTGGEDVRSGALTVSALCWAVLYAFGVGAAAFAGERESNTLGFLDALPVGRWTLWFGKVSFAIVSTAALALVLTGLAELGTVKRDPNEVYSYPDMIRIFGTLLVEALAWSLFFSSFTKNPLLAGAMAVPSLFGSAYVMTRLDAPGRLLAKNDLVAEEAVRGRLLVALAALVISGLVMSRRSEAGRSFGTFLPSSRKVSRKSRAATAGRSLVWQTFREGSSTGLLVFLVGLVIPVAASLINAKLVGLYDLLLAVIASLVAGVSVFGTENATGSRQFLVHHGVCPGMVWGRKVLVWVVAMALLLGLMLLSFLILVGLFGGHDSSFGLLTLVVVNAFTVGILCGMAIPRRLTAALVGALWLILIVSLQATLFDQDMIPGWTLALTPLILVAVSRAWAADWLLERQGLRPWLKLGVLLAVPFGLLGGSFITYRAFGVRDIGPQFDEAALQGEVIPADQNAAEVYRQAANLIRAEANFSVDNNGTTSEALLRVIAGGWDPQEESVVAYWKSNQKAIGVARKASKMPRARFDATEPMTLDSTQWQTLRGLTMLDELLALDTRERLSRGDLAGAWDGILAQLRMAGQLQSSSPTLTRLLTASVFHQRAVALAFIWLAKSGQSAATTRRALSDLKSLPPVPNLVETIRVESSIVERSLQLPGNDLASLLLVQYQNLRPNPVDLLIFAKLVAAPWERERARRVCRLLAADELRLEPLEPWKRGGKSNWSQWTQREFNSSRLIRLIAPYLWAARDKLDRDLVERRALVQAVAALAWKLDHSGEAPAKLEDLVPGYLDRLPIDPYSGKPFGYVRSVGQPVLLPFSTIPVPTKSGQPLIYSVGLDRKDDGGKVVSGSKLIDQGDLVFPVP